MTQIVDERLKKMCDECHSHLDKPCAWLSLGNEYCTEIMNIQQELQRKDNIINDLKSSIADYQEAVGDYQDELKRKDNIINELKEELYHIYNYAGLDTNNLKDKIKDIENEKE